MKTGRNLNEVVAELNRQKNAKRDFISSTNALRLRDDGWTFEVNRPGADASSNGREVFGTTQLFHRQVGSVLGIPAKYYDMMRS